MNANPAAKWWLWPSALSLEAPAVAVAWQDLLARSSGSTLWPEGRLALGLTVWAVYLADRLIDVRRPSSPEEREPHQFCRDHRWLVLSLLAGAVLVDAFLALFRLRPQVSMNGLWVGGGAAIYLLAFAWRSSYHRIKPWAAALLFAAGVFLVTWTRSPSSGQALVWQALVFFALCLGNLLLARSRGVVGIAMTFLAFTCALRADSIWFFAAAFGAVGLAVLAALWQRLSNEARCLLADLVLLVPALRLWTLIG